MAETDGWATIRDERDEEDENDERDEGIAQGSPSRAAEPDPGSLKIEGVETPASNLVMDEPIDWPYTELPDPTGVSGGEACDQGNVPRSCRLMPSFLGRAALSRCSMARRPQRPHLTEDSETWPAPKCSSTPWREALQPTTA